MPKAYIDTTVLTNALLKRNWPLGKAAIAGIARYASSSLPVYAIKEFKGGPLANYVYVHNKLVSTQSLAQTIAAIHGVVRKRYQVSTALEALAEAARAAGGATTSQLEQKYGEKARSDRVNCDEYRLALKALIFRAWERRRKVTSYVIQPLACYSEEKPFEKQGLIRLDPKRCDPKPECCLALAFRADTRQRRALERAIQEEPQKPENARRLQALASLRSGKPMTEKMCRDLGDAIFAFFAPADCTILTTNRRDFDPLAASVGKNVDSP